MAVTETNKIRWRAILISRHVKWIFGAVPSRLAKAIARRWFTGWILRLLFLDEKGELHIAGEAVLAELRDRYMPPQGPFNTDPLVMARNVGRREVLEDIFNYLHLDEKTVQTMMRLDDGLE